MRELTARSSVDSKKGLKDAVVKLSSANNPFEQEQLVQGVSHDSGG